MIRPGTPEDIAAIAGIQADSREAAQWDAHDYLGYELTVAVCGGGVVGFLVARTVAVGERELLNLAVRAEYRRRGIASRLLHDAIASETSDWFLEVRESNSGAISFYEREGFQRAGVRRKYYSDPAEDAVVMRKTS